MPTIFGYTRESKVFTRLTARPLCRPKLWEYEAGSERTEEVDQGQEFVFKQLLPLYSLRSQKNVRDARETGDMMFAAAFLCLEVVTNHHQLASSKSSVPSRRWRR